MKTVQTLGDVLTMGGRCLLLSKRNPDTILTSITTPILTMLLFAYIIGGAMQTGETGYVNFTVPGIILQCLGQYAATTVITICSGIGSGIMERFRTVPVKRPSILNGRIRGTFIRSMVTALLILLVVSLIGFRPGAGLLGQCAALLIIPLYILTLSWTSVYFRMITDSPGRAGSFSILTIVLPCISSGFVPIDTMPKVLQIFAKCRPITPVTDSLRILLLNESLKTCTLLFAISWCTMLPLLFYILSVRAFRKKNSH